MAEYRERIVDDEVAAALRIAGAVLIERPRGCGKTETGRRHAASEVLLDTDETVFDLARLDPSAVLHGRTPRLIDHWQLEPRLWNHVRRAVDDRQDAGQFIRTDEPLSVLPLATAIAHGGWPGMQDVGVEGAQRLLRSYLDDITCGRAIGFGSVQNYTS